LHLLELRVVDCVQLFCLDENLVLLVGTRQQQQYSTLN